MWKQALQSKTALRANDFVPTAAWQKTINWMAGTELCEADAAEAEQGLQDYITIIATRPRTSRRRGPSRAASAPRSA